MFCPLSYEQKIVKSCIYWMCIFGMDSIRKFLFQPILQTDRRVLPGCYFTVKVTLSGDSLEIITHAHHNRFINKFMRTFMTEATD